MQEKRLGYGKGVGLVIFFEFMERGASDTRLHLAGFIDCVRTRKQPVEDVWAGHRAAACAHMINASAETGAVIRWDDDKNRIARA